MIAFAVNRVTRIGIVRPHLIGEVLEVRFFRVGKPPLAARAETQVSMDFLQEHYVCPGLHNALANALENKASVAAAEAFMDVVGQYTKLRRLRIRLGLLSEISRLACIKHHSSMRTSLFLSKALRVTSTCRVLTPVGPCTVHTIIRSTY